MLTKRKYKKFGKLFSKHIVQGNPQLQFERKPTNRFGDNLVHTTEDGPRTEPLPHLPNWPPFVRSPLHGQAELKMSANVVYG